MYKEIFGRIVQFVTTLAAVLKSALPYPVSLTHWPKVVIIGAWAISILSIRPNQRWSKNFLIISMIGGLGCGFSYWVLIDSTTIKIDEVVYIRGDLTERAKDYMKNNPAVSEKEYFIASGKKEDWVWKPESRKANKIILGSLYSLFIFFFGISFLGALEKYARSNSDIKKKLAILKSYRDKNLITQIEYDQKKAELLENL